MNDEISSCGGENKYRLIRKANHPNTETNVCLATMETKCTFHNSTNNKNENRERMTFDLKFHR